MLLLVGTQILDWYWLVLLGAIGLGIAIFRVSRRRLAPYRVAQVLDRRLHLYDSLSTAWFLHSAAGRSEDFIAQLQIARAEELAGTVRLSDAFPFRGRRAWAITGALAATAFGLFAVRYLVTSSLSLRQSLIPIHLESIFERSKDARFTDSHPMGSPTRAQQEAKLSSPQHGDTVRPNDASSPQDAKENGGDATAGNASGTESTGPKDSSKTQEGRSETHEGGSGAKAAGLTSQDGSEQTPKAQASSTGAQQDASPGLMDKMKDALSSLMAKMRPDQNAPASAQNSPHPNEDHTGAKQNSPAGSPGRKDPTGQQQNPANQQASQDQNAAAQAQGQTTEKAQASPGQNSDQSPQSGSDAHSGIGRQDGDKDLKEAGQLQALGKLEEIIGKRSANLTGEMTVETPANKQQLKTAYSQRLGRHSDAGGEINRDEIPLAYQQYVREYMEQVRKQGTSRQ